MEAPVPVRIWVDPSCPWAWQTSLWLRELRDRGLVELSWSLFSLELNASEPGTPFWDACSRHGVALVTLALARREGGDEALEALYDALGQLVHELHGGPTDDHVTAAAARAGMDDLPGRAQRMTEVADALVDEYLHARSLDVFGVPTLQIDDDKVVYGPLVATAPTDEDAEALWEQTRGLSRRTDFFELKRWPRDIRPSRPTEG